MSNGRFAGALLRMYRLERNWSQETLAKGTCAVSYLSKIEQGKVCANESLLRSLFEKLDIPWQSVPRETARRECQDLYEMVFADDRRELARAREEGLLRREGLTLGEEYLDYLVLRAYCFRDSGLIPGELRPLLDDRQNCLLYLLEGKGEDARRIFPCALTYEYAGIDAYRQGKYTYALEMLNRAYTLACEEGYFWIMTNAQAFLANCYADLRDRERMTAHYKTARRMAVCLGDEELCRAIDYNIASTGLECGDYALAYLYFAQLKVPDVMDLHKLAICCEHLGKREEAMAAVDSALKTAQGLQKDMCMLVKLRLDDPDYLGNDAYGQLLLTTYQAIRRELPSGYARFHLDRVEEWCRANRKYRTAYEILRDFL